MNAAPPRSAAAPRPAPTPLPDFCSLPVLFALVLVAALTVTLMWLAPGDRGGWRSYSVATLFVVWMALLATLALCRLRPLLQRLPGLLPYAAVWLLLVALVLGVSALVAWLDRALAMNLTPASPHFVRDGTLAAALLAACLLRYFYVVAQWQARLAAVAHAQVEALQARIRPHFLFNSMNTVAALVRVDPAAAERTVEDLAELFRAALGQDVPGDGTLGEELALLDRYLAIEQLRLGERLRVRRELDGAPADFPLPRLLLQPLAENAVRHGIQPRREGGEVALRAHREGDALRIEIDNPLPEAPAAGGSGHGLDSVRQRVAYRYGAKARVEAGPQDGRFVVKLWLPLPANARRGKDDARTDRR